MQRKCLASFTAKVINMGPKGKWEPKSDEMVNLF